MKKAQSQANKIWRQSGEKGRRRRRKYIIILRERTESRRVPCKFLATSILTTFAHLSFYKNGRAGKSGSWRRGSNRLIPSNVRDAMLPIAQMGAIVCVLNGCHCACGSDARPVVISARCSGLGVERISHRVALHPMNRPYTPIPRHQCTQWCVEHPRPRGSPSSLQLLSNQ